MCGTPVAFIIRLWPINARIENKFKHKLFIIDLSSEYDREVFLKSQINEYNSY